MNCMADFLVELEMVETMSKVSSFVSCRFIISGNTLLASQLFPKSRFSGFDSFGGVPLLNSVASSLVFP